MASHEYVRFILKTPMGYLTPTGTTQDICNKDVIILNIFEVGGYMASKEIEIQSFLDRSTANIKSNECEVLWHACNDLIAQYSCEDCIAYSHCNLWHNRRKCIFNK